MLQFLFYSFTVIEDKYPVLYTIISFKLNIIDVDNYVEVYYNTILSIVKHQNYFVQKYLRNNAFKNFSNQILKHINGKSAYIFMKVLELLFKIQIE